MAYVATTPRSDGSFRPATRSTRRTASVEAVKSRQACAQAQHQSRVRATGSRRAPEAQAPILDSAARSTRYRIAPLDSDAGPSLQPTTIYVGPLDRRTAPEGLVLVLHGCGGTARCFEDMAHEWAKAMPRVAFIMPTAPQRGRFTAWFNKSGKSPAGLGVQPKCCAYTRVEAQLLNILESERARLQLDWSQVALLGYSAGSMMASWLSLKLPAACAGLVCLHGICPDHRLPPPPPCPKTGRPPALLMAGGEDVQIIPEAVEHSRDLLKERFGFKDVTYVLTPDQPHSLSIEELDAVLAFFQQCLLRSPASVGGA